MELRGLRRLWVLAIAASLAARTVAADEAADVVAGLHQALVEVAAIEPTLDLDQRAERLAPVVTSTHDLATMARLTVSRRFWRDWSEAERGAYTEAFERLSVRTYASRFASIRAGQFQLLGSEPLADDRFEVMAAIRRDAPLEAVPMDYTLQRTEAGWRIVNIVADGVSELSLMSARHFDILESGDFDELLADLERQIAELE